MTVATDALGATVRVREQSDYRRNATLRDQHGRPWVTQIDTVTMHPCVAISPKGWSAPFAALVPPQKYLKTPEGSFGELVIDYDQWIIDWSDAGREYATHLMETAKRHFGAGATRAINERDAQLRELAGPSPAPVDFVRAMKSGRSKWALGFLRADGSRYPMPEWAQDQWEALVPRETYGGTGADLDVLDDEFPEEIDETALVSASIADRYDDAERFADVEDEADPNVAPSFMPLPRARGKKPRA